MTGLLVRAAVSDGAGQSEVRQMELSRAASRLQVESSAVCGTDVMLHQGGLKAPAVLGHHTVGRIDHLADADRGLLQLPIGTRVVVEEYVGCRDCDECRGGRYRFCPDVDLWTGGERVGMIPVSRGSGLHGGNAEYLELTSRHALHPIPESLGADEAAWTLPLANAVDWTLGAGEVGPGAKVAVIGPGYHGLACVAAAQGGGADLVLVIGRESSRPRLELANRLGAETAINSVAGIAAARTSFGPFDAVVDTIGTPETMESALELLGRFGILVVAGLSGGATLVSTAIVRNLLTVRGVRGRAPSAVVKAIELLAAGTTGLDRVPTHKVSLEQVGPTLRDMDQGRAPASPHVVIDPWLPVDRPDQPEFVKETR